MSSYAINLVLHYLCLGLHKNEHEYSQHNEHEYLQHKSICLSVCMCSYEPLLACWHVLDQYICVSQKPRPKTSSMGVRKSWQLNLKALHPRAKTMQPDFRHPRLSEEFRSIAPELILLLGVAMLLWQICAIYSEVYSEVAHMYVCTHVSIYLLVNLSSCSVMPCQVMSCNVMSGHVKPCNVMSRTVMECLLPCNAK